MRKLFVSGSLGFIGSNFVKYWLDKYPADEILGFDAETYAARGYLDKTDHSRLKTLKGDVTRRSNIRAAMDFFQPDVVVHMAAESHVCRSIAGPEDFMMTNAMGTFNMLEEWRLLMDQRMAAVRAAGFGIRPRMHFIHISTDEVFGDLGLHGGERQSERHRLTTLDTPSTYFQETNPYLPRSPYAASKAASDHIAKSYFHSYGLDVRVMNCSNNYGPNQHEEKLIPRTIKHLIQGKPVIVHGKGDHVRDWIHVDDHARAIEAVLGDGRAGESYCVGAENERTNLEVIQNVAFHLQQLIGPSIQLRLEHTDDRPTDDERYAVDSDKLQGIGWSPKREYSEALRDTVKWYLDNVSY